MENIILKTFFFSCFLLFLVESNDEAMRRFEKEITCLKASDRENTEQVILTAEVHLKT